tara:strand:- start:229 stop:660 length:432 start_codon:yes stop_codon:yes gene_type:complete
VKCAAQNKIILTSNRPYLIRALYEWLIDNEQTPHLLVDAQHESVLVPTEHVEDGRIVLNISPSAIYDFDLGNEAITFRARFGGKSYEIHIPPDAVLGIYSQENGQGMLFPEDHEPDDPSSGPGGSNQLKKNIERGKPSLKVVK